MIIFRIGVPDWVRGMSASGSCCMPMKRIDKVCLVMWVNIASPFTFSVTFGSWCRENSLTNKRHTCLSPLFIFTCDDINSRGEISNEDDSASSVWRFLLLISRDAVPAPRVSNLTRSTCDERWIWRNRDQSGCPSCWFLAAYNQVDTMNKACFIIKGMQHFFMSKRALNRNALATSVVFQIPVGRNTGRMHWWSKRADCELCVSWNLNTELETENSTWCRNGMWLAVWVDVILLLNWEDGGSHQDNRQIRRVGMKQVHSHGSQVFCMIYIVLKRIRCDQKSLNQESMHLHLHFSLAGNAICTNKKKVIRSEVLTHLLMKWPQRIANRASMAFSRHLNCRDDRYRCSAWSGDRVDTVCSISGTDLATGRMCLPMSRSSCATAAQGHLDLHFKEIVCNCSGSTMQQTCNNKRLASRRTLDWSHDSGTEVVVCTDIRVVVAVKILAKRRTPWTYVTSHGNRFASYDGGENWND